MKKQKKLTKKSSSMFLEEVIKVVNVMAFISALVISFITGAYYGEAHARSVHMAPTECAGADTNIVERGGLQEDIKEIDE